MRDTGDVGQRRAGPQITSPAPELPTLRVQDCIQRIEVPLGHAGGGKAGHDGLEHAAGVDQLVFKHAIATISSDRSMANYFAAQA